MTRPGILVSCFALALAAACHEPATAPLDEAFFAKGPPPSCGDAVPLSISFGDAVGDAVQSDGAGPYVDGADGTSHLNGPTGNLMLWTAQDAGTPRVVNVTTTAFSGGTTDRVYTNNHEAGCGFKAMANGATGYAVFEVELGDDATGIVRYGKTCGGTVLAPASRTVTTRSSDGLTWTVTGTTGVHCRKIGKNRTLTEVGTAGPFSATLVATP